MKQALSKNIKYIALVAFALSAFSFSGCSFDDLNALLNQNQQKPQTGPAKKTSSKAAHATASGETLMPEAPITAIRYRPLVDIGKELVSGTGTADTAKARSLSRTFSSPIIVNPEIFKGLSDLQSLALREAIADACKKAEADFLLTPRYELTVETNQIDTKVTCKISGYPAKIIGFEEVPPAPTRQELVTEYLEIMQKYGISKDVHNVLALMGEHPRADAAETSETEEESGQ